MSLGMPEASSTSVLIVFLFYVFLFFFSWKTTTNIAIGGRKLFVPRNRVSVHKFHPVVMCMMSDMIASMAVKRTGFDCFSFFTASPVSSAHVHQIHPFRAAG